MDAGPHCALHSFPGLINVAFVGPGKAGNNGRRADCTGFVDARRPAYSFGDALDGPEIAERGCRKSGLHDIDSQARQLAGDFKLFLLIEGGAGRLLAVAQGGVEDKNGVAPSDFTCPLVYIGQSELFNVDWGHAVGGGGVLLLRINCVGHYQMPPEVIWTRDDRFALPRSLRRGEIAHAEYNSAFRIRSLRPSSMLITSFPDTL